MYLKQLELENFKSFGKKISIPLLEGYTAVTGPNGSGKSNISDAILFVLGPKSSKALRAAKLTDLIFNGGPSKQPADYCKASLIFDNKDRIIPCDADIVKLTRLVKLSESTDGYNSYFYVNDRKSSLGEFDQLLATARISADGYNVVQQGDVTRIVTMSTVDRRRILDDISGISKYDEEIVRAEAERKAAEENIDRIGIILTELDRQIKQLEDERTSALRYLEARDKLTLSKAQMAHKKKEATLTEITQTKKQMDEYAKQIESLKLKKQQASDKIKEVESRIAQLEKDIEAKGGGEFAELKQKMDAAKIEIARAQEQSSQSKTGIEEIDEAMQGKVQERSELEKQLADLKKKQGELEQQYLKDLNELETRKHDLDETNKEVSDSDSEVGTLGKRVEELDANIKKKEEERHALVLEKERADDRRERLSTELANLEEGKKTLDFELSDTEFQIKELKSADKTSTNDLKALQEELFQKRNLEGKLSHQAEDLEAAIIRLTREYSQLKAEQEAAENVARGYNRAVRSLLDARDKREIKGIHGTIAQLAEVDPKHEVALNIAAGNRMQSIVVDDDEVAATAIQFLKRGNLGRATFLPLNKMLDGKPRGKALLAEKESEGFAIDLVRFDEKYRAAFWYVFGDTVVVETLDKARKLMGGVRLVTLSGELIESSGAMVGGAAEGSQLKFGAGKGKLDEVADELRRAKEQAEKVQEELVKVRQAFKDIENALREANNSGSTNSVKVGAFESRRKELKERQSQAQAEITKLSSELSEVERSITNLGPRIDTLAKEALALNGEREGGRKRITEIAPQGLATKLKKLQSDIVELTAAVSREKSEKDTAEAQLELLKQRFKDVESLDKDAKNKVAKLKKLGAEAAEREKKATSELNALKKIEESMSNEVKGLRDKRDAGFKEKTKIEGERDQMQVKIETSGDFTIGLQTKVATAEDRLKELDAEIQSYNVPITLPLPTLEDIKETIASCERILGSMGAVNLRAIEDYNAKQTRQGELKEEAGRLDKQRKDLIKLMDELNEKKKEALGKVFVAINENFKSTYAELSGGGEAELVLENPTSPFEGGLIMKVKPRNGKVLRLDALSGGEKSLAALALVFAIQQYMPSPFYLLDEVDMFLDAVNADMVAQRVAKSSKTAQFVQISLRKVTLGKADHLIGVTKGEVGISQVIMKPNIADINDVQKELQIPEEKAEGAA
ncbi:MAG TPA: chromosome segregation protein SMC [Methanomassiliicoccales archaeon]|nr:chromosome segregation protein SMC [Methanomassiliicoccales archaeon]